MREETLAVNGISVNYKIAGEGPAVLILHGWGRGSDSWTEIQERLAGKGYKVAVPDLPGFGKTEAPKEVWGVDEYSEFAFRFSQKLNLVKFFLLGHSFGGQVAVRFAASHPEKLEKLILCAPAAIRREPGFRENVVKYIAKVGSRILFFIPGEGLRGFLRKVFASLIGRSDYLQAPGVMRKVMQKVIREDLSSLFSKIDADTLLIWGENDRPVPLKDSYIIKERIPNSSLKMIPRIGHRVYQEAPEQLVEAILQFLGEQKI